MCQYARNKLSIVLLWKINKKIAQNFIDGSGILIYWLKNENSNIFGIVRHLQSWNTSQPQKRHFLFVYSIRASDGHLEILH